MDITILVGIGVALIGVLLFLLATPQQKSDMQKRYEQELSNNPSCMRIIFFLLFIFIVFVVVSEAFFTNFWAEIMPSTQGWITSVEFHPDTDGDYFRVGYSYEVEGQVYSSSENVDEDVPDQPVVNAGIIVYHMPNDPGDSFLRPTAIFDRLIVYAIGIVVVMSLAWSAFTGTPLKPAD